MRFSRMRAAESSRNRMLCWYHHRGRLNYVFFDRGVEGIVISRLPKRRASTDRAPGPMRETAAATVATNEAARNESNRLRAGVGNHENPNAIAATPTMAPANGVRNPKINRS